MLKSWKIRDFKSFRGEKELSFGALTVLCGANSSGKSSIVQSILLIKQTLQHAPSSKPIALNGPLVRLGTFHDIENFQARTGGLTHSIGFGWEIIESNGNTSPRPMSVRPTQFSFDKISINFTIDVIGKKQDEEILQIQPSLNTVSLKAEFHAQDNLQHDLYLSIKRTPHGRSRIKYDSMTFGESIKPFNYNIVNIDQETKLRVTESYPRARLFGCIPQHFFPSDIVFRYDRTESRIAQIMRFMERPHTYSSRRRFVMLSVQFPPSILNYIINAIKDGLSANISSSIISPEIWIDEFESLARPREGESHTTFGEFFQKLSEATPPIRRAFLRYTKPHLDKIKSALCATLGKELTITSLRPEALGEALAVNNDFFRFSLNYLGPLRDEPRPLYPLQALASSTDVGPKGELTAAVLHLNEGVYIDYIPSNNFSNKSTSSEPIRATLRTAVVDWLNYLGVAIDVQTSEKGKFGHELNIKTNEVSGFQDLTNVGVGVSQVLPIVVMSLLSGVSSTIILEQPELHLHPAVQAKLGDFFISMSLIGKQCIIESHSEYIIERIRFRIASDASDRLIKETKIYFLEQKLEGTELRTVELTNYGAIEDWPENFFDQSQAESERIILAALKRRQLEKKNKEIGGN